MIKKIFTILFGLFVLTSLSHAETYKVYVGNAAGSLSDVYSRKVFEHVEKITGDNFVIINKPGADQLLAYQAFLEESRHNPNVIYSSGTATQVSSYAAHPELKLDPLKDTKSLITVALVKYHLIVRSDSPVKSVADLKGKVNIGSSNSTTTTLISKSKLPVDLQIIPYKSDNEIILALLKNEINVASAISLNPLIRTHKDSIKIISSFDQLGVTGATGYTVANSFPEEKFNRIHRALDQVLQHPDIRQWFVTNMGTAPVGGSPKQYDKVLQRFKQVVLDK